VLRFRSIFAALLLLLQAACGTRPPANPGAHDPWEGRGRECVRAFLGKDSPTAELSPRELDEAGLAQVPAEARRTAQAAGIEPLLAAALSHAKGAEPTLQLLTLKQDLGLRLISLETQLAAMIFEAECTGELIEAMTFELDQIKQSRGIVLAVASLVVGAALATAAGVWDLTGTESKGPAILGLSGGVGGAALGAAAFVPRASSLRYGHTRNLLVPIVRNDDHEQLYPTFVFRLLTLPARGERPSPREQLLVAWRTLIEESVPADQRAQASALLYGEGGVYSQELLALRERMYDALETQLNALARDLELLDRYLVRELALTGTL
jgi:hypothetical protein